MKQHHLGRRIWPLCLLACLLGCGDDTQPSAEAPEPRTEPPPVVRNVLLMTADDLGLQLGSYGESRIATPELDRLAQQSLYFPVAYVTQASCSSSRSSLLTGLYPSVNGQLGLANHGFAVHTEYLDRLLPNLLQEAGVRTGLVGKLHVAPENAFAFDYRVNPGVPQAVRDVAVEARRFLEETEDQPFFLMVSFFDPHAIPDPETGRWLFPEQIDGLPEDPLAPSAATLFTEQGIDTPEQRERTAGYLNAVRRLDHGVGLLLDLLEELGHADDTLVIFVGDHGPPFARAKTTTYEFGLRVPLFLHWPGRTNGQEAASMVSTIDIYPTILDALDVKPPQPLHGQSLLPLIEEPERELRQTLYAEWHYHGREPFFPRVAIRDRRYKLIHNLLAGEASPSTVIDGDRIYYTATKEPWVSTPAGQAFAIFGNPPEFEFYDLEEDPFEMNNLVSKSEYEEQVKFLKGELSSALQ